MSRQTTPPIRSPHTYDAIIAGMGCAGLSLAVHLVRSAWAKDKRILLVDRERKDRNDRTWCFWEAGAGPFEDIVHRRWEKAWFHAPGYSGLKELRPYAYKMIRGIDYYRACMDVLEGHSSVEMRYGQIEQVSSTADAASVRIDGTDHHAVFAFNSILFEPPVIGRHELQLLQHFKGWVIETAADAFDTSEATLMDFRPAQQHGTTFVYVMPLTPRRALVEYTLFTPSLLAPGDYDKGLTEYIHSQLGITAYTVAEEEFGVIPMTNHRFPSRKGRVLYIGTAGGQTKPSSGYTFRFIQKHSAHIVDSLLRKGHPFERGGWKSRYDWYDSVLLHILQHRKLEGGFVFRELFRNNPPRRILKFLDDETTLPEEIRLLNSLPQWPFMKAGMWEMIQRLRR
ncbi:MAG: lycopene cyclase [Bacteroidetes bacterium]|nr:lycopene cyclase [Bacteroidota bacterium]